MMEGWGFYEHEGVPFITNYTVLNIFVIVSFTVLFFDHFLTFQSEIDYVWKRFSKGTAPVSILFLLNRYFSVLALSGFMVLVNNTSALCNIPTEQLRICHEPLIVLPSAQILVAFSIVTVLIAEAILALRVYAIYQGNKPIMVLLFSIWTVHLVLLPWIYSSTTVIRLGDALTFNEKGGVLFIVPAIIFDLVVGILMVVALHRRSGLYQTYTPLMKLIFQDGLLYFAVIFVTNIVWLIVHLRGNGEEATETISFMPLEIWSGCITTTMIGRLTLNLRMYNPGDDDGRSLRITGIRFNHPSTRTSVIDSNNHFDDDIEPRHMGATRVPSLND